MTDTPTHAAVDARLVQVVYVSTFCGGGAEGDPVRQIDLYFSLDGEALACFDPLYGPDPFRPSRDPMPLGGETPNGAASVLADPRLWADDPVPAAHAAYRAECLRVYGNYEPYGAKRRRKALSVGAVVGHGGAL